MQVNHHNRFNQGVRELLSIRRYETVVDGVPQRLTWIEIDTHIRAGHQVLVGLPTTRILKLRKLFEDFKEEVIA